jgi:glycosyltransferase involved in cell wall biosynthesis
MSGSAPKVSVVLTTYNRAHVLPVTLDSILSQTLTDFELIVSDDHSSDDTPRVAAAYAAKDGRVRYRRNATNLKMPGNLNAGIAEARGEFVANLHDGDIYRADLLEKWATALERYPSAAFVFNQYLALDRHGGQRLYAVDMPPCLDGREFLRRVYIQSWGSPVFGTVMARRACYAAVGPFDARYSFDSDIEMWVRLASRYDVAYIAEPLITVTPRETHHVLAGHRWWELTNDVRVKRLAMDIVAPRWSAVRLWFELRARYHYAWQAMPALRHGRWRDLWMATFLALTGRDGLPTPY